ncbi:hypothetical protein XENORESO_013170 [Xenotaenia resolanae]|uniref:Uncharacterized protein n=1 Tax=Xenotaenia resolanae TaxID=208358 RepID=A0ABV0W4I7_9TELE
MESAWHPNTPRPPPPPPPCWIQPFRNPPPRPQHAAVPFLCDARLPVQETGDQQDVEHDFQTTEHDTPPSPLLHSQDYPESYDGIQQHPVQETDPAPQKCENPQVSETTHPEDVKMAEDDAITLPGSA